MCTNMQYRCCGNWTDEGECRSDCVEAEPCGNCDECDPLPTRCAALTERGVLEGAPECGRCPWCLGKAEEARLAAEPQPARLPGSAH